MSKVITRIPLDGAPLGIARALTVHRYGLPGARPKAYLQAALHADEIPGMLVAHHLIRRLDAAVAAGAIRGEILVVPSANPIGLDQVVHGVPLGRFALAGGGNFNRHYPELAGAVAERVRDALTGDATANVALIRAALARALAEQPRPAELDRLRHTLLDLAIDADIVLDLHCDAVALVHLYLGTPLWPEAEDLARQLGCAVVLLAETSGGDPFDEACSAPWWRLRRLLGGAPPIPAACLAATVELRGETDVSDALAAGDADNLFRFLQRRGLVLGDPGPLPPPLRAATPLAGVDMVKAPVSGVVAFRVGLGDRVRRGEIVAEIVDPLAEDPATARTALCTVTDGPVWAMTRHRFVRPGDIVAKVAGTEPLPGKGALLLTDR